MGALHEGHLALIEEARARADHVVTSIFVNPIQFGADEDLDRYPRREASDAKLWSDRGRDVLWAQPEEEVYPPGFATNVSVGCVSEGICGGSRPGNFDVGALGVATMFNNNSRGVAFLE